LNKNSEYNEEEVAWYQEMLESINQEIKGQMEQKEAKFKEIKGFIDENHKSQYEKIET
jgi:hypothetical protein